jgi:hypothetical protein
MVAQGGMEMQVKNKEHGNRLLPTKPTEIKPEKVKKSRWHGEQERVRLNPVSRSLKQAIRQCCNALNSMDEYGPLVAQHDVAQYFLKVGYDPLINLPGLVELKDLDARIIEISTYEDYAEWEAGAKASIEMPRGASWDGYIKRGTNAIYASLAQKLHLPKHFIMELGIGACMVGLPTEPKFIQIRDRKHFLNLILDFGKWIPKRMERARRLIREIEARQTVLSADIQFSWDRDILEYLKDE